MKDVLIVDDETPFLQSLAEGLGDFHSGSLNVILADNGKKAIEILRTITIDVVVTDLRMPVADGYELLEYLMLNLPDLPVIVMTAHDGAGLEQRLKNLKVTRYIEKPIDFRTIANHILSVKKRALPSDRITAIGEESQ